MAWLGRAGQGMARQARPGLARRGKARHGKARLTFNQEDIIMNLDQVKIELESIRTQNNGMLLPSDVVEAARPETSPIHSRFEWDDGHAAEQYRLTQARNLIRIVVDITTHESKDYEVRTYVSLTSDRTGRQGYRLITDVLENKDTRAEMISDAFAELRTFRTKYGQLKELARIFEAIDATVSP